MKYFVEKMPDDDLYKALLTGAPEVDSEWATVVRLAYRAGVKAGTTRHLQRPDFEEGYVNLGHRLSKAVVRRRLPAERPREYSIVARRSVVYLSAPP